MARNNDDFTPETVDEQIERFLQLREPRQQVPSAALTQALKAVCEEDVASLERVWECYAARIQALPASSTQFSTHVSSSLLKKKELAMHNLQEKSEAVSIRPPSKRVSRPHSRLMAFGNALVAIVVVSLIVISSFMLFRSHLQTTIGSSTTATPTPTLRPTSSPASHVILNAVLTDLSTVGSEGIGPMLSGLVSKNHFTVGRQFWLYFVWSADSSGPIVVKWYANDRFYSSSSHQMSYIPPHWRPGMPTPTPQPGSTVSSVPNQDDFSITYNQPATGKVELYWNGQLAATLSFVVKSEA